MASSGNQLLSITSGALANTDANIEFCDSSQLQHHSSSSGYSDPYSLNSTLTANEGSAFEDDGTVERCLSSPMPPLQCLHCERISSECICLDSEEEDLVDYEGEVQCYPSYDEDEGYLPLFEVEHTVQQRSGEDEAINHANRPPAASHPNINGKQMFGHQQNLQRSEVHQPLPSFEQLLASLGLRAGFVIYRNRHQ